MKQSGFTLIELMVTVMIIAILATIAYPSYMIYINKSKATSGQQAISAAMTTLEQSYVDNHTYPTTQTITDTNNYFGYTYTQGGTGTSAGQSYYINALGNAPLGQYYIAANSNDVRCVCMNCSTNPLSGFTDTNTSCPAGSTPW